MEWTGSERVSSRRELVLERGRDSKSWGEQVTHRKRERLRLDHLEVEKRSRDEGRYRKRER